MSRFVVLSGCSGAGKSSVLAELGRRGYATVDEPGRRIVRGELNRAGRALPWVDATAFARQAIAVALADLDSAASTPAEWVFFDRGLVDAVAALRHLTGDTDAVSSEQLRCYHRRVFLTPPWPEIYVTDTERRHGFYEAAAEYERLVDTYQALGYERIVLPKIGVQERANLLVDALTA